MLDENNILETINMIKLYNLDIRTVTLALSLRDCIAEDTDTVCKKSMTKLKNMLIIWLNMQTNLRMNILSQS